MSIKLSLIVRILTGAFFLLSFSAYTYAQNADALSVVVDSNGDVYRLNYQCDIQENCPQTVESITSKRVKRAEAVAIGRNETTNYVFLGNDKWRNGSIELLIEREPGADWEDQTFSGTGASAMVVTRNNGALFVARPYSPVIESFARSSDPSSQFAGYMPNAGIKLPPLRIGWIQCLKIVGLEEYPAGSGDLIAFCAFPGVAFRIENPLSPTPQLSFVPGSASWGLTAGAVTTVPVNGEQRDYLLLAAERNELIAIDLQDGSRQKNLLHGRGRVRSTATALCNFFAPSNDVDADEDVDGPCGVMTESGGSGQVSLFEIDYDPQSGKLVANVREQVKNHLRNPYGIDFVNTGTVQLAQCMTSSGCQIANNRVVLNLEGVDPDSNAAFETQGPFTDSRYDATTGTCSDVDLPLAFTHIPVLEHAFVGAEFCARNGVFFVDIISAPDVAPTRGYTQFTTPGDCWVPGFDASGASGPGTDLDGVEYGLLYGDQYDLFRIDGTNSPNGTGADYINNLYAQDNLVGCGSRVRAGGRLTFVIEDFVGNDLQNDLGTSHAPIADNVLYRYGNREANERINVPLNALQSGCHEEIATLGYLTGACEQHIVALNGGLAGWELQRDVGATLSLGAGNMPAGSSEATGSLLAPNLTVKLVASGGTFTHQQVGSTTVVGVSGATEGEIDPGESLSVSVSTIPRPNDTVLSDGGTGSTAVTVGVPFVADDITLALFFDGPEFGDVEEVAQITATLADDVLTATLINTAEEDGTMDTFSWTVTSAQNRDVSDLENLAFTVLSGDDSSDVSTDAAVVRLEHPFGDRAILGLELTAVNGTPSSVCPTCSNQSDFAIQELTLATIDRVAALAFAYRSYLQALCPVSTRPDYGSSSTTGTRPKACIGTTADTDAFNLVNASVASRNSAGHQQADVEGALRFIAHNICELDYDTDIDPAGIGFNGSASESFCRTTPEWAPIDSN